MNHPLILPSLLALSFALSTGCSSQSVPIPNNTTWTQAQTGSNWWLNAWASAADDRWVVGGTNSKGAILHYDGTRWSSVDPGIEIPLLNWTHGFARDDMIMVGNEGTILTYDGATFTKELSPSAENLWGVWGPTKAQVYAVGGSGRPSSKATLLLRDNGDWRELEPEFTRPNVFAFFKVWGSSEDDIYVVGQKGIVIHWDGATWEELDVFGQSGPQDLIAVWGTGPDKVAMVGGRNNGVLILKDGPDRQNDWRMIDLAANAYAGLNGVWMGSSKVHTVGNSGQILRIDYATGLIEQDILLDTQLDLHAIHGSPDGVLTTVSFNPVAPSDADAEGEIYTRDTDLED